MISKVADVQLAQPGAAVHFTLTVTNIGSIAANNVVVVDAIPSPLILQSATASQGTFSLNTTTNTVTFNVGTVAPGQVITLGVSTIVSKNVTPPVTITNSATLTDGNGHTSSSSSVVRVTSGTLPGTGEHPIDPTNNSGFPTPILVALIAIAAGGLLLARQRWARR